MDAGRVVMAAGVAVAAASTAAGLLWFRAGAVDDAPPPDTATTGTGSWERLAPMPLSPRFAPITAWTGEEVLVVGGVVGTPCPPSGGCEGEEMAPDGAAYDPATDTWRPLADAPLPLDDQWFRSAMVGDVLVVADDDHWWSYDVAGDRWRTLPPLPDRRSWGDLAVHDGRVHVLAYAGRVMILDPATGAWTSRRSQVRPMLEPTDLEVTDDGIFVSGFERFEDWEEGTPRQTYVDRFDGEDWTRAASSTLHADVGHWTGTRFVHPYLGVATDEPGAPPYGGVLDPATGEWLPLTGAPDEPVDDPALGWSPYAVDGPLIAVWGYLYDDRTGEWVRLGRPRGSEVDQGQSATWADGRLLLVGGYDDGNTSATAGLSDEAWAWTP